MMNCQRIIFKLERRKAVITRIYLNFVIATGITKELFNYNKLY